LTSALPAYSQLTLSPGPLADGIVGQGYNASVFTNGNGPTSWTIIAGSLPPGVGLSPGQNFADFTGTPTAAGIYSFTLQAVDTSVLTAPLSASRGYTIQVNAVLTVVGPTLPPATQGIQYTQQLQATGGILPYYWVLGSYSLSSVGTASIGRPATGRVTTAALSSGLPAGMMLTSSGQIVGVPTRAGAYAFDVTVTDSSKTNQQFAGGSYTIVVNQQNPLLITTTSPLPSGTVGSRYSIPLRAQGGRIPYQWALSTGSVPPGLALGGDGSLTGVPTEAGTYAFALTVTDASNNLASETFMLVIGNTFAITMPSPLQAGAVGVFYSAQISVTPTTPPYTFSVSAGSLPAGLSLAQSSANPTGVLSGTPTAAGSFAFTVVAADGANHTASQRYTLVIGAAPITIAPATLPEGTLGTAYSQQLAATGGEGGYTFSLGSGALPGGIKLSSSGLLSGTPTATGAFSFTVSVSDSRQVTVSQAYQLNISSSPLPTPTITGVGTTAPPAQQPTLSVQIAQTYPTDLTGTMTLAFASAVGNVDDPSIQFSTGGRSVTFTIPSGQTTAVFPAASLSLGTGTVAGTITLTLHFEADGEDVTPQPAPKQVITIAAQAPLISKVTASSTFGGIHVDVTGFSNTREMVSATFTFQAASGGSLQGSQVTISADQIFAAWFNDAASKQYGSQFTFAQPFTIGGSSSKITRVSVTLTNKQGASSAVSASLP
jgi:hypothetical protein